MFVNKWTVQLSCPGELVEQGFDSEEEVLEFIRKTEDGATDGLPRTMKIIDPEGKEKVTAPHS